MLKIQNNYLLHMFQTILNIDYKNIKEGKVCGPSITICATSSGVWAFYNNLHNFKWDRAAE